MPSLNPYISFHDSARAAMEFYQSVLGGELDVMTFEAFPDMGVEPSELHLVMHAQLETPDGFVLMGADTPRHMEWVKPAGISVSISGDDEAALERWWNGLAEGGSVTMPFETPPWGGRFGMLTDRFGIEWMLSLNAAPAS
ncbi:VOC family protein [Microbacterium rhizomatis]|uniref:VOC family protein n=1 Tax=Microbacterium rhizomatis TaxID=1631477 RepID=A0A5J5J7S7_9MICO|nr:VOC family protein [Microbacterium rhizomatis]KAA9111529.1 VOC family protein [Microbacterium rhizomatis]